MCFTCYYEKLKMIFQIFALLIFTPHPIGLLFRRELHDTTECEGLKVTLPHHPKYAGGGRGAWEHCVCPWAGQVSTPIPSLCPCFLVPAAGPSSEDMVLAARSLTTHGQWAHALTYVQTRSLRLLIQETQVRKGTKPS